MDAEAIYKSTPAELAERQRTQEREYIENGPAELRPLREKIVEGRRRYVEVHRCSADGCTVTEAVKAKLEAIRADMKALEAQHASEYRELELGDVLPENRNTARDLLRQRDADIAACHDPTFAGRWGASGGQQFNILARIDNAERAGDRLEFERLQAELEVAKQQGDALAREHADCKKKVQDIYEDYRRQLSKL